MTTTDAEVRPAPQALTLFGMLLVVAGMQVFIIQPDLIAIIAGRLGLMEDWAGYIASGEIAGIAAATIRLALAGPRVSWPKTALAGADGGAPAGEGQAMAGGARPLPVLIAGGLFFLGQGFVWAFLGLIGLSFGIAKQSVVNGLMVAQLAGIGGAFCLT